MLNRMGYFGGFEQRCENSGSEFTVDLLDLPDCFDGDVLKIPI